MLEILGEINWEGYPKTTAIALHSKLQEASLWELGLHSSWHILLAKAMPKQSVLWWWGATPRAHVLLDGAAPIPYLSAESSNESSFGELFMSEYFQQQLGVSLFFLQNLEPST